MYKIEAIISFLVRPISLQHYISKNRIEELWQ